MALLTAVTDLTLVAIVCLAVLHLTLLHRQVAKVCSVTGVLCWSPGFCDVTGNSVTSLNVAFVNEVAWNKIHSPFSAEVGSWNTQTRFSGPAPSRRPSITSEL